MNKNILNTEIQKFINQNLNTDIASILLKGTTFSGIETKEIVEQIESKKKCIKKLPTWSNTENIYFPNKLNIEQTSSEITAEYKSKLISGKTLIDITGGFGVDCYYFSKQFKNVTHCEINEQLSKIVAYNSRILQAYNIKTYNANGIGFLNNKTFDCIYIDPSRRHDVKGKVFFLNDCLPNIPKNQDFLFQHTNTILIKTSPLLDISVGLNELKNVEQIHVVSVNNEVKELLWLLKKGYNESVSIKTINILKDSEEKFNFKYEDEPNANTEFSLPLNYLYEPNASVLKSGAFKSVSNQLNVFKLHQHSHLYTSERLISFPGRVFKINNTLPFNKQLLKKESFDKANISTRNFPETVQNIRKKFKIKDGGNRYLFFTTNFLNEKIVLNCSKL